METEAVKVNFREDVFEQAKRLVDPIVAFHGLQEYCLSSAPFVLGSKITPTEQHIDHIIRVADWLLEP